jgi:DNA polymerase III subunit delta'
MPFRDVVGHVRLIELLSRSIGGSSLPPSLLFAGPSGIGKHLTAVAVAQALNCTAPIVDHQSDTRRRSAPGRHSAVDACGVCSACTRIARGMHPDVLFLSPSENGNIKIDPVREAIDRAQYRPFEGRRRVVIIDEADALVAQAQNALLKTLEEPTPSSVFILVTSRPDMLLPTVLSRCPQLRFRHLSTQDIAAALIRRGHSEVDADAVAATADGSLAHAMDASAEELVAARWLAQSVLRQVARESPAQRATTGQKLVPKPQSGVTEREELAPRLRAMAVLLRDVELVAAGADPTLLANRQMSAELEELASYYQGEPGTRAYAAVDRALSALRANANAKLVADWLVQQL